MLGQRSGRPLIGAHRGASGEVPENTIAAFDRAIADGAELLELDVHRTADGHLVVQHDAGMRRTAGRATQIGALTLDEVRTLDVGAWFDERWRGLRVPTLDEVLDRYGDRALINIEIKVESRPYPEIERGVVAAVVRRMLERRVVVSSFDQPTLQRLREASPAIYLGVLAEDSPEQAIAVAGTLGAIAVHLDARLVSASTVAASRAARLAVVAWTVDDEREMRRLIALDVDAMLSNYPARLARVVRGGPVGR